MMLTPDSPKNRSLGLRSRSSRISLDPEFEALIPPLALHEFAELEQSILTHGCREPVTVWKDHDILLDGYNRCRICATHGLPEPRAIEIDLPDREAAKDWIRKNQMARRNLSIEAASYLRGQAYNAVKHDRGGDHRSSRSKGHVDTLIQAARQIALAYGVSPRTIKRDGRFAKAVDHVAGTSPIDAKRLLLSHGAKVTQRYVLKLARLAVADIRRVIAIRSETGTWPPLVERGRKSSELRITLPKGDPKCQSQALWDGLGHRRFTRLYRSMKQFVGELKSHRSPSAAFPESRAP